MTVNCESNFWTVRDFLPSMLERNKGQIVTIASACGLSGLARLPDYCASKFGQVGFSEALRSELKAQGKNITCTTVCPYVINTGMFEGASTSWLFPILEQEYTADRILSAILQEEGEVAIPWKVGILQHFGKAILPSDV